MKPLLRLAEILAKVPQVVGVKLGDGDNSWYEACASLLDHVGLYMPGHHLATGVKRGVAVGSFSNVACLNPSMAQTWTNMMETNIEAALEIEQRINRFVEDHILPFRSNDGFSNTALDKLFATIGNWAPIGLQLRWPYRSIDSSHVEPLRVLAQGTFRNLSAVQAIEHAEGRCGNLTSYQTRSRIARRCYRGDWTCRTRGMYGANRHCLIVESALSPSTRFSTNWGRLMGLLSTSCVPGRGRRCLARCVGGRQCDFDSPRIGRPQEHGASRTGR